MTCLTPQEIADILKISYESALAFIKCSGIDYLTVGNQYRVVESKFNVFLSQKGHIEISLNEKFNDVNIYNTHNQKKNKGGK